MQPPNATARSAGGTGSELAARSFKRSMKTTSGLHLQTNRIACVTFDLSFCRLLKRDAIVIVAVMIDLECVCAHTKMRWGKGAAILDQTLPDPSFGGCPRVKEGGGFGPILFWIGQHTAVNVG